MLAFNIQGERFEPPASAMFWRVRRLKTGGRGTLDVVYAGNGAPLILPIESELADFRRLVNHEPERYRLDPVDDDHRACDGATPAYLQVAEAPVVSAPVTAPAGPDMMDLMERLIKANTEMVRNIGENFASVMESAATLIRAADGAGLPAREPVVLKAAPVARDEEEDEDGDEEDHRGRRNASGGWARFAKEALAEFLKQCGPSLMSMVTSRAPHVPAHNGARSGDKLTDQARAASDHKPRNAGPAGGHRPVDPSPVPSPDARGGEPDGNTEPEPNASADDMVDMQPADFARLLAVEQTLTPPERASARALIPTLSVPRRNALIRTLRGLTDDEATAHVRRILADHRKRSAEPRAPCRQAPRSEQGNAQNAGPPGDGNEHAAA